MEKVDPSSLKPNKRSNGLSSNILFIAIVAIIFCQYLFGLHDLSAAEKRKVLVLHSYHQEFPWTDNIMKGIKSVFDATDILVELYVEYMDVKRHLAKESFPHLDALYNQRYDRIDFDVIVLSDDFALDFVLRRRGDLFKDTPIVFCGINNFGPARIAGHDNITGVAEDIDIKGTIDLALQMHPNTRHIAVINDGALPGVAMMRRVRAAMSDYGQLNLIELFDLSIAQLKQEMKRLPENTVILHIHYYNDKATGKTLTVNQSFDITRNNTHFPIYTGWDFQMGYGAFAGMVTNGEVQGQKAAQMAMRILKGESADDIAIIADSPNTPMFDYTYLDQYDISLNRVPEGSYILNQPESFYYKYWKFIWLAVTVIGVLVGLNIILFHNINKRKRVETKLMAYQNQLEDLVDERTREIKQAMAEIKQLSGLLPFCSHCKKVRDDQGYWNEIEAYIEKHSDADISHSICPVCAKKYYPDLDIY